MLYLKEATRLLYHTISGRPDKSTFGTLVAVTPKGIPRIIPKELRYLIMARDSGVIRGILTLLTVYRVMYIPSKANLAPIVEGGKGIFLRLPIEEVSHV